MNAFCNYNWHLDLQIFTVFETDPEAYGRDKLKETHASTWDSDSNKTSFRTLYF